jgi:hypothetical protein
MSNGQAERFVATLKCSLRKLKGEAVDDALTTFLFCYRSTPNVNCPGGKSPAEVFLGHKMRIQLDLLLPSARADREPTDRMLKQNAQFDRRNGVVSKDFEPGDLVLAHVHHYNKTSWVPGRIVSRIGSVMYNVQLNNPNKVNRFHANQLRKRFYDDRQQPTSDVPLNVLLDDFHLTDDLHGPPEQQANVSLQVPVQQPAAAGFSMSGAAVANGPAAPATDAMPLPVAAPVPAPMPEVRRSSRIRGGLVAPSRFNNYVLY